MKRFWTIVGALAVVGGTSFILGAKYPRIIVPRPEVIMAEDDSMRAARAALSMNYRRAAEIYEHALALLPANALHRRLQARSLAHMGHWEAASSLLISVASDTAQRGAVEADLERLRLLQTGRAERPAATGAWERMRVRFAQGEGVGAVALTEEGLLATLHPSAGRITFRTVEGSLVGQASGLGLPLAVAVTEGAVWVADMDGDRAFRIEPTGQITARIDLGAAGVHGARSIAVDEERNVWVADFGGRRVCCFSPGGALITEIGGGRIEEPAAVLAYQGDILIAESAGDRVLRFDRNGRLLRAYVHRALKDPVALALIDGDFVVKSANGLIFWNRGEEDELVGPLRSHSGVLVASGTGFTADRAGNFWWGDGGSLCMARRLPVQNPTHVVEILRIAAERDSRDRGILGVTVSVMDAAGRPVEMLDRRSFRIIRDEMDLKPVMVEDLSHSLPGRRIVMVLEASDAMLPYREHLAETLDYFFRALTPDDRTAVLDVRDSFRFSREFTVSRDLVRRSATEDRPRIAAFDVKPYPALRHAVEVLAPTDFARAVLWVTDGEGITAQECASLKRIALINQTPIFVLHVGEGNHEILEDLARGTNGGIYRLYGTPSFADAARDLAAIRSGRYRISVEIPLPAPLERGRWMDVTCEALHLTGFSFDRTGYYSF